MMTSRRIRASMGNTRGGMGRRTVRALLVAGFLLIASALGFACEFTFSLTDSNGDTRTVVPGSTVMIESGASYVLTVRYSEDHGRCTVPPEDTMFLLDEEKWRASKDHLPLRLTQDPSWEDSEGGRTHETRLSFTALEEGEWTLEIVRECDRKEGYDESFVFLVS